MKSKNQFQGWRNVWSDLNKDDHDKFRFKFNFSFCLRVALYSEKRTKQDQRHVEDTLSLNRQSHVERDYKNFASDERIDACIVIKGNLNEKTDINARRLTCFIFEVSCITSSRANVVKYFSARQPAMAMATCPI